MALILCIETSTRVCSVGLAKNGEIFQIREDTTQSYSHAEQLNVLIDSVLKDGDLAFENLDAVAVSEGPGSYTGLRIGVSTAKGIAMALDIPIIAVSPLRAMCTAVQDGNNDTLLLPMIDARRMEVFTAGYTGCGEEVFHTRAEIIHTDSFPERADFKNTYFFGDGAQKVLDELTTPNTKMIPYIIASARGMAPLAESKYQVHDFVDTAYFEPFYLKDFVAGKPKQK